MHTLLALLKETILFSDLPDDFLLRRIIPYGHIQEFDKDNAVISLQEKVSHVGILLSGKVQITHIFPDGNTSIIDVLTPSKILGADLIFTRTQISHYYAICSAPSRLFFLSADVLLPASGPTAQHYQLLQKLLLMISNENIRKEYRLAILSQKGLRERILTYLTMQADKRNNTSLTIPFSRDELAEFLCVNRSALSHELSLMQKEGILTFRKNQFTLLQYKKK